MSTRTATAHWEGPVTDGAGTIALGGGTFRGPYSWRSRFEQGMGANPEELVAAAHAGCYSMALAGALQQAGHLPASIDTHAKVKLEKQEQRFAVTSIALVTRARVRRIDDSNFSASRPMQNATAPCPKPSPPSARSSSTRN